VTFPMAYECDVLHKSHVVSVSQVGFYYMLAKFQSCALNPFENKKEQKFLTKYGCTKEKTARGQELQEIHYCE